jgi:hypothetical protein
MSDQNLPAIINKAEQLIEQELQKGSMVFVRKEDVNTQSMFVPEMTILKINEADCHTIEGNKMPNAAQTDRIGEAGGVSFIAENCGTKIISEDIVIGYAQGEKRQPDGTWRKSKPEEYEFDCKTRAELDFINDKSNKYATEVSKRKHLLELRKKRTSFASTGARLKVIRALMGMPISFKPGQLVHAIVVGRIALNTDKLLEDPVTRGAVIQNMLGSSNQVYGPTKALPSPEHNGDTITATAEVIPEGEEIDLFGAVVEPEPEEDPAEVEYRELRRWIADVRAQLSPTNQAGITAWMQTKAYTDMDELRAMKAKIEGAIAGKKGGAI